jgi:two-component system, response regulator YesN
LERYRSERNSVHWSLASQSSPLIRAAAKYMQTRYAEAFTLSDVARHVHCHPVHLSRIFKQEMKINFSDYLQQIRIGRARLLLTMERWSVSEVGFQVGYQDTSHFIRVFRRLMQQSPGEYRRKNLLA